MTSRSLPDLLLRRPGLRLLAPSALAGVLAAATLGSTGCEEAPHPPPLQGQVHLTFLHTSDIHSRLYPYNLQLGQVDAGLGLGSAGTIVNVGGAARISHIVGRERARASRVLHIDGGDCFQGAPVFNFFAGEAEIRSLSAMGVDAMLVANHEFDRGALNLGIQVQKWANFPVLAANYMLEDPKVPGASPLASVIVPYQVFDTQGLKVAVIGMGNLSSMTSIFDRPNRLGITPLNTIEVAQFYIDQLRPMVDVVAFITHLGLEVDQYMIENTTGIDVVLGGHNHIVLQPPKRMRDCAHEELTEDGKIKNYVELPDPEDLSGTKKIKRYCTPRDVLLAHSGAFAKYVGRLDLIVSNDPKDLPGGYEKTDGFEVLTHEYKLFPVNEEVPEDPVVGRVLEPYAQGLDTLANLELLVGYALDGSRRFSTSGGDSALGNLVATAAWQRLGIKTDFSLTNTTGIRADLVPGPVTVEQMYNIFPFDNSISKMQLSGIEVQELFDFVARRSAGRGCVSQVQIAGARVVIDCLKQAPDRDVPGVATNIYIGAYNPAIKCSTDAQCPGKGLGSCDPETLRCWQAIDPISIYELATSNYLAQGGSGFRVLQRNTTQLDTKVQQRDALIDFIRGGFPCGADDDGDPPSCSKDADCAGAGEGYVCACPEATLEADAKNPTCRTDPERSCTGGQCVLAKCRDDVATFIRETCEAAPTPSIKKSCESQIASCASAGEQCKFLPCVDRRLGNFSDGRIRMVGQ